MRVSMDKNDETAERAWENRVPMCQPVQCLQSTGAKSNISWSVSLIFTNPKEEEVNC